MLLSSLLERTEYNCLQGNVYIEINSVAYDSRKVTPGSLFVAISGFATDGNKYIPMAMERVLPQ